MTLQSILPPWRVAFVVLTAWLPVLAYADSDTYTLDPVHTRVAFQVSHAGLSNPIGTFSGVTGQLHFDPDHWQDANVSVQIPLSTLNLGDVHWQEKILGGTYFDVANFAEARFTSTRVEPLNEPDAGSNAPVLHAHVFGTLELHGVLHEVMLDVRLNALKRHPLTLRKTAGFSATATLSRKDFGLSAWSSLIGDDVHLIIEAEAIRSNKDNPEKDNADSQHP